MPEARIAKYRVFEDARHRPSVFYCSCVVELSSVEADTSFVIQYYINIFQHLFENITLQPRDG